jgi:acyl carrier protein
MKPSIADKVREIIVDQLEVDGDALRDETSFIDDLGADSLGVVELVLAFEEAFEISIPDEDTERLKTVRDVIGYIEARVGV